MEANIAASQKDRYLQRASVTLGWAGLVLGLRLIQYSNLEVVRAETQHKAWTGHGM